MTQHGNPFPDPGPPGGQQSGGQPPYGQPHQGQSQYWQPAHGQPQYGQPQYGQPQHGDPRYADAQYGQAPQGQALYGQPPASGYHVPAGASGYGHIGHPQPGGFTGQAGYAPQQPVAPNGQELADVWMRLLARLIDGLIVTGLVLIVVVPLAILVFAVSISAGGDSTFLAVLLLTELAAFVITLIAQYLYDVEFAKRTGQTIGKRVLKLRVVSLDPNQPVERGVLAKRWLVSSPGGLVPGLGVLNVLWCLWDQPYRQCLHDKFAKTVVVKVPA